MRRQPNRELQVVSYGPAFTDPLAVPEKTEVTRPDPIRREFYHVSGSPET